MSGIAKFKLNLKSGEIELEGSEDFVEKQILALESLVQLMGKSVANSDVEDLPSELLDDKSTAKPEPTASSSDIIPSTFGEWMHSFKTDLNDLDKALITARFVQSQSKTNDFKTSEVNNALKEHGIKLTNASSSLNRLVEKKLMFQTRKVGVLKFVRVSVDGQKQLDTLKR